MKKKLLLLISVLFMFPVIANADIKFPKYINGNTKLEGLDTLGNGDVVYYQWVKYKEVDTVKINDLRGQNRLLSENSDKLNDEIRDLEGLKAQKAEEISGITTQISNIERENSRLKEEWKTRLEDYKSNLSRNTKKFNGQYSEYLPSTYMVLNEEYLTLKNDVEKILAEIPSKKSLVEKELPNCDDISGSPCNEKTMNAILSFLDIFPTELNSLLGDAKNHYDSIESGKKEIEKLTNEKSKKNLDYDNTTQSISIKRTTLSQNITKIQENNNLILQMQTINDYDDSKWNKIDENEVIKNSNFNSDSILYIKTLKSDGSSSIVSTNYNYDASTGQYKNVNNTEDNTGKKQIKLDKITLAINSTFDLASLLEDTSIIYSSNNAEVATISSNGLITGLKAGTAIITAEGTGKIYTIDVEVKGSKIEDSTGNSSIIFNGDALDEGTQENYNKINENDNLYKEIEKKVTGAKRFEVIEITLTKDGQNVQPKSKVTVEIKIPSGYNPDNILVYYVEENGTLTLVNHIVVGDKVQIDTDKVGKFVIVEKEDQNKNESSNNTTENPKTGTIISISAIVVGIIVATGIYFYTKKKNKLFRL